MHGEDEGEAAEEELLSTARKAQLRALMRGARELAVLSYVSHPSIVQVRVTWAGHTWLAGGHWFASFRSCRRVLHCQSKQPIKHCCCGWRVAQVYSYCTRVAVKSGGPGAVPQLEPVPEGAAVRGEGRHQLLRHSFPVASLQLPRSFSVATRVQARRTASSSVRGAARRGRAIARVDLRSWPDLMTLPPLPPLRSCVRRSHVHCHHCGVLRRGLPGRCHRFGLETRDTEMMDCFRQSSCAHELAVNDLRARPSYGHVAGRPHQHDPIATHRAILLWLPGASAPTAGVFGRATRAAALAPVDPPPGSLASGGSGRQSRSGSMPVVPHSVAVAVAAGTPAMRAVYLTLLEVRRGFMRGLRTHAVRDARRPAMWVARVRVLRSRGKLLCGLALLC
jgi:hypothetical protein